MGRRIAGREPLKSHCRASMHSAMDALTDETPPPAPGWTAVAAGQPLPPAARNGLAVAALVLGVLGLSLALNPVLFLLAVPVGLAALVLGVLGVSHAREAGAGKGQAIAGAITGGLAAVLGLLWIAGAISLFSAFSNASAEGSSLVGCAGATDRRVVDGRYRAGGYTFTGIEVCSDSVDDFAFSATVRNDGSSAAPVDLQVRAGADGTVLGTGSKITTIAPGGSAEVDFLSFDDYQERWTEITVAVE